MSCNVNPHRNTLLAHLVGDLETALQEDGRELGVRLCSQPQTEVVVRLQTVDLLLEQEEQTVGHQVQVLQTQPLAFLCALLQQLQRDLRLTLTHGNLTTDTVCKQWHLR